MEKLTRHKDFKALKQEDKTRKTSSASKDKLLGEYEAFLTLLQKEFSKKKKSRSADGRQTR